MAEKIMKPSAGAEDGNPQAFGASSPNAKRKKPADAKLIKKLFLLDPLDWARYPDGTLAFIAPDGSKHKYTAQQLEELSQAPAKAGAGDAPAGVASSHNQTGVRKPE